MKYHFVVNPAGASGRTGSLWFRLRPMIQDAGIDFNEHFSSLDHSIETICKDITTDLEEDINLVVIGGDGTINEAINGIKDFHHVRLGIIPSGSGNDLARSLHLSNSPEKIVRQLLKNHVERMIDIGEVTYHTICNRIDPKTLTQDPTYLETNIKRRFNNGVGMGFDAEVCQKILTSSNKKKFNYVHLGKLIYISVAMQIIFRNHKVPATIRIDEEEMHFDEMFFTAVMNQPYEGGGLMMTPDASCADGLVNMCVVDGLSTSEFFKALPKVYKGKHIHHKGVTMGEGKKIEIHTKEPMWVQTDGEVMCQSDHISVEIAKEKIRFLL